MESVIVHPFGASSLMSRNIGARVYWVSPSAVVPSGWVITKVRVVVVTVLSPHVPNARVSGCD